MPPLDTYLSPQAQQAVIAKPSVIYLRSLIKNNAAA